MSIKRILRRCWNSEEHEKIKITDCKFIVSIVYQKNCFGDDPKGKYFDNSRSSE
jgi:hypothetical protein